MHCKLKMLSNLNSYHQHCISAPLSEGIQRPGDQQRQRERGRKTDGVVGLVQNG